MTSAQSRKESNGGHRKRLRDKFIQSGLEGFHDYEIVELLLTLGTPRKDCKQAAKDAIVRFNGLKGVLDANFIDLKKVHGIGDSNAFGIKLFQTVAERYTKENLQKEFKFDSKDKIDKFLIEKLGREQKEHFIMLCLDSHKKLIFEDVSVGILNASLVHPREVFKKAIEVNAAQIIVAHNHPSGDPTPSSADIDTAQRLAEAGNILGIGVSKSIVVSKNGCVDIET